MRAKMKYAALVLAVLLTVLTGCGSMMSMPFNGDITFHEVSMTVPETFIRDSAVSNEDLWAFERDNYEQIILLSRADTSEDAQERIEAFYSSIGGTATKYEQYECAYRAAYTKDDVLCQEVMFVYGENLYTITLRGAEAAEFEELLKTVTVGQ